MRHQHYLELALHEAIKNKKPTQASKLIDIIMLESNDGKLESVDKKNRSFLYQALDADMEELVTTLLDIQANNNQIIFGTDIYQKTLFHMAAQRGYVNILKRLITICNSNLETSKFWLSKDSKGNTALHVAAQAGKAETVKLLIEYISNEKNASEILNQTNGVGKTALHEAFYFYSEETIKLLIENGADFNIKDNQGNSPFNLFCKRDLPTQIKFLTTLQPKIKDAILTSCREELINNNQQNNLMSTYFTLLGLQSLQALVIGHLEFNEDVPLRNYYHHVFDNHHAEKELSLGVLKRMPLYYQKIMTAAQVLNVELEPDEDKILAIEDQTDISNYQLLNQDRVMLNALIREIDNYLQLLQTRKHVPTANKVLAKVLPLLLLLALVTIVATLSYEAIVSKKIFADCEAANKENKLVCEGHRNTNEGYTISAIFTGIFGTFAVFFAGCFLNSYFKGKLPNISSQEKDAVLSNIEDIVENLQKREKESESIRALEKSLKIINSKSYLPINKVIVEFTNFKKSLIAIRSDLNHSQQPISLFFKPRQRVIEINEVQKHDLPRRGLAINEGTPLLG